MKPSLVRVFVVVIALLSTLVQGWGTIGHQAIAQCAQTYLTPTAAAAVSKLLQTGQTFASVSTYADSYRSTSAGAWSAPMHYTNVARGTTQYSYPADCPGLCVVSAIFNYTNRLSKNLNAPAPEPTNLEWLVHFIADVHQPLHVGYASDSGGNGAIVYWYGTRSNLHTVWDTSIITKHLGSTTWQAYAVQLQTALKNTTIYNEYAKTTDPSLWANESLQFVLTNVYDYTGDQLGDPYQNANWPVVNLRAMQACVRVATTFNNVFV
jgi:hypothetical protein